MSSGVGTTPDGPDPAVPIGCQTLAEMSDKSSPQGRFRASWGLFAVSGGFSAFFGHFRDFLDRMRGFGLQIHRHHDAGEHIEPVEDRIGVVTSF